jgi:hypothetical protein
MSFLPPQETKNHLKKISPQTAIEDKFSSACVSLQTGFFDIFSPSPVCGTIRKLCLACAYWSRISHRILSRIQASTFHIATSPQSYALAFWLNCRASLRIRRFTLPTLWGLVAVCGYCTKLDALGLKDWARCANLLSDLAGLQKSSLNF